jgi:hypothetical protein
LRAYINFSSRTTASAWLHACYSFSQTVERYHVRIQAKDTTTTTSAVSLAARTGNRSDFAPDGIRSDEFDIRTGIFQDTALTTASPRLI